MASTMTTTTAPSNAKPPAPEDPSEPINNWSSLIGIITAIVGNVLIALALNVQRYAHTRLNKERVRVRVRARAALKRSQSSGVGQVAPYGAIGGDEHAVQTNSHADDQSDPLAASYQSGASTRVDGDSDGGQENSTYLKSPYWWLGQILITLGETGNFLAYGFAPASIVSPLGVVALISNCIIAPVMFHEHFRARDFWGVVIAVAGVVTVVLSAKQEETKLEPHDVWDAITTMEFEVYLGVTVLLILVLMWASGRYGRRTILIDLGLVGLFGGYTALATKGVSSMLSSTLWRAFTTPVTYALVLILVVTAVMQIRYVNKALQRFDSTQVIPIQFVLFTLCVIVGSAILYRDFEKTTPKRATKFVGGCLLTFFGVFLITSGRQRQEDNEEDVLSEAEGVEETFGLVHHEANASPRAPAQETSTPKSQSRRSSRLSRVSFAETVKPGSPPDDADVASMRPGGPAEGNLDLLGEESSPLLSNPWRESWDGSEPDVHEAGALWADSASAASAAVSTSTNSLSTTPVWDSRLPLMYHVQNASTPRRNSGLSRSVGRRRSKTFISPSPLSSTVTTVVKDAVLGGYNVSPAQMPSLGRLRSRIRAGLFFNDDEDKGGAEPGRLAMPASDDHSPRTLRGQQGEGEEGDEEAQRRRQRSVSDALSDLFRPRKMQSRSMPNDSEGGGDGDADASGSARAR